MKKLFTFLLFLSPFCLKASHEKGAQVSLRYINTTDMEVRIKLWVDSNGLINNSVPYSVQASGATTSYTASLSTNVSVGNATQELSYLDTLQLNATATYKVVYDVCCRNGIIANLTNASAENLYTYAELMNNPAQVNSNPEFQNTPMIQMGVNDTMIHNPMAIDPDGDSLAYYWVNPQGANGTSIPMTFVAYPNGGWPFWVDSTTGEITWIPTMTGSYAYAVRVDEYRNGVKIGSSQRDALVTICVGCKTTMVSGFEFYNTAAWPKVNNKYQFDLYANTPFNLNLSGGVPMTNNNNLALKMIGDPNWFANQPTLNATQTSNNITGTYTWTPTTAQVRNRPYMNVLIGQENSASNERKQSERTLLFKVNQQPSGVTLTPEQSLKIYPNPAASELMITLDNHQGEYTSIAVYSSLGQTMYKKIMQGSSSEAILLNVADWASGSYFVVLNGQQTISRSITVKH
ncbi:MAG: T9SS type A sorting domain-containing protein [Chitinophagaceae bacterium]|nr:T9SS type A sorting domain-containing protein [Chitinophagaceae bacterium]